MKKIFGAIARYFKGVKKEIGRIRWTSLNELFKYTISAVCIRTSTERPEALDSACFVLAGIDEKNLMQAVEVAVMNKEGCKPVDVYVDTNVSDKVVKIIQSYTGVVNKMVWRKEF